MARIANIYSRYRIKNSEYLSEDMLFRTLNSLGKDREIEYIKSFGGKKGYDRALSIQNDEITKSNSKVTKLSVNNEKLKKIRRCKVVKKVIIGTLIIAVIGTISYFDKKSGDISPTTEIVSTTEYKNYVKLYYFVQEGDTFESISEEFDTKDIKSPIVPNTFVEVITDEHRAKEYLAKLKELPMGYIYYKIKDYETPANIADGFYISRTQIWIDNNMEIGEDFQAGETIKIGVYSLNQLETGPKFDEVEIPFIKLLELKDAILNSSLEPITSSRAK